MNIISEEDDRCIVTALASYAGKLTDDHKYAAAAACWRTSSKIHGKRGEAEGVDQYVAMAKDCDQLAEAADEISKSKSKGH